MTRRFVPDYCFLSYRDLSCDFIREHSIRAVVLDIDNTLLPYELDTPDEELLEWFSSLEELGVKIAFVSNNKKERVMHFNEKLQYVAFWSSWKPFKFKIERALKLLGEGKENACLMGDQIWTDVVGGHNAGLKVIIVPPIKDKTDPFTKLKRFFEKPFLKKYRKEHPESYESEIWSRWKL